MGNHKLFLDGDPYYIETSPLRFVSKQTVNFYYTATQEQKVFKD